VWLALLGVSGLIVFVVAGWLGLSRGASFAARAMIPMYAGASVGVYVSALIVDAGPDAGGGLVIVVAIGGIPFWILAGVGIGVGALVNRAQASRVR